MEIKQKNVSQRGALVKRPINSAHHFANANQYAQTQVDHVMRFIKREGFGQLLNCIRLQSLSRLRTK